MGGRYLCKTLNRVTAPIFITVKLRHDRIIESELVKKVTNDSVGPPGLQIGVLHDVRASGRDEAGYGDDVRRWGLAEVLELADPDKLLLISRSVDDGHGEVGERACLTQALKIPQEFFLDSICVCCCVACCVFVCRGC